MELSVIICIFIIVVCVTVVILLVVKEKFDHRKSYKVSCPKEKKSKVQAQYNSDKKMFSMICSNFEKAGWTQWDPSIHSMQAQIERARRAIDNNESIRLCQYDSMAEIAKIQGSSNSYYLVSGHRCSCPDFRERQLPCKHMYYLSLVLPEYKSYIDKLNGDLIWEKENPLWGLKFSIVGRNQEPVKKYILIHGGDYGNESWRETSAIVLASDMMTQRLQEGQEKNIEILTFDNLKSLFNASS